MKTRERKWVLAVATLGVTVGIAGEGCSSETSGPIAGNVSIPMDGGGPCSDHPCGTVAMPVDAGDAGDAGDPGDPGGPCSGHPCGSIALPVDGGDAGDDSDGGNF